MAIKNNSKVRLLVFQICFLAFKLIFNYIICFLKNTLVIFKLLEILFGVRIVQFLKE